MKTLSMQQFLALTILPALIFSSTACGNANTHPLSAAAPPTVNGLPAPTYFETSTFPPVPDEYQELYNFLQGHLDDFHAYMAEKWDGTLAETTFACELLAANGNQGEMLLRPDTMIVVRLYLDRMQELGIQGATIQVSYPMLSADFPRSEEYKDFYRQVAEEVHRRGMKLTVESSPVFGDKGYSKVQVDFSGLTLDTYFAGRREHLLWIAQEMQPDYLSIGHEPNTETMLTGLTFSLEEYAAFVNETLAALKALDLPRQTMFGAGYGMGEFQAKTYNDYFIEQTQLDFINLHIYPIYGNQDYLRQMVATAEKARANGKRLIVGESWLYKATPKDLLNRGSYPSIYARDVYSFWQPLDISFIQALSEIAHYAGFDYVSFFWTRYFFAYLEYDASTHGLSVVELVGQASRQSFLALQTGEITATGLAYKQFISGDIPGRR